MNEEIEVSPNETKANAVLKYIKRHAGAFAVVLLVSRMIVFFSFLYTATILYNIGYQVTAGILGLAAVLFLILNKLEKL